MRKIIRTSIIAAVLFMSAAILCNAIPSMPSPPRLVNDLAGVFTPQQTASLERTLVAFDDSTSNQITVVTVNDLEGYSAMEYATRIGLDWKVGSADFNNGVVLLIKPKTQESGGQVAISVGYGLEGAIPDAYAKRIIENELIPHFKQEDYFGGASAACTVLMQLASGEISEPRGSGNEDIGGFIALGMFIFFVVIVAMVVAVLKKGNDNGRGGHGGGYRNDSGDIMDALIIGSLLGNSGRRSSWGGSGGFGGGFSGGFGGFGGGSFGGGGASGSW